jgi:hypothetical protein
MATFNYFKAKEQGFSDEEIVAHLAEKEKGFNYQKALEQGFSEREIIGKLAYGIDPNATTSAKAAARGAERGHTSTDRGISQIEEQVEKKTEGIVPEYLKNLSTIATLALPGGSKLIEKRSAEDKAEDLRREYEYELYKDQGYSKSAMGGYAAGTISDPYNLIGGVAKSVGGFVKEGLVIGGVTGFLDPTYTDEGNSVAGRTTNAAWTAAGGAVIGGALGKLLQKFGAVRSVDDVSEEVTNVANTVEKKVAEEVDQKLTDLDITAPKVDAADTVPLDQVDNAMAGVPTNPNVAVANFDPYSSKLPVGLEKAAPRYGRDVVRFDSDLDRALYIVGNDKELSAGDQRYMDWIKTVTGISDESTIRQLGKDVKKHVKATPDKGFIPASKLAGINPITKAVDNFGNESAAVPVVPLAKSPNIPKALEVDSAAWKTLDSPSRIVYNMGRQLLEAEATGTKPKISLADPNVKLVIEEIKKAVPDLPADQMGKIIKAYARTIEDLSVVRGKEWSPSKFDTFLREGGISKGDEIALTKAGFFDGCQL